MENRIIRIENGAVSVPQSGNIRMTRHEIAALFDVYVQTVHANIKAVLKAGIIEMDISGTATISGNTVIPDVYGLEMIIALAFRIKSRNAEAFRRYVMRKVVWHDVAATLILPLQNSMFN